MFPSYGLWICFRVSSLVPASFPYATSRIYQHSPDHQVKSLAMDKTLNSICVNPALESDCIAFLIKNSSPRSSGRNRSAVAVVRCSCNQPLQTVSKAWCVEPFVTLEYNTFSNIEISLMVIDTGPPKMYINTFNGAWIEITAPMCPAREHDLQYNTYRCRFRLATREPSTGDS